MSDCPLGCEWRYDPQSEPLMAWRAGDRGAPVVWDGTLRRARGDEVIDGRKAAAGAHMCFNHPDSAAVQALGPIEAQSPIAGLNELVNALLGRPARRSWLGRLLGV